MRAIGVVGAAGKQCVVVPGHERGHGWDGEGGLPGRRLRVGAGQGNELGGEHRDRVMAAGLVHLRRRADATTVRASPITWSLRIRYWSFIVVRVCATGRRVRAIAVLRSQRVLIGGDLPRSQKK